MKAPFKQNVISQGPPLALQPSSSIAEIVIVSIVT